MTLMLGNRYFLDRDYARAAPLLEAALAADPACVGPRKKLVITHLQLGDLDRGLVILIELLESNPRTVIDTNPEEDDCPCPALCVALEKRLPYASDPWSLWVTLGVLELYCDLTKSRGHLQRAADQTPEDLRLRRILGLLEKEKPACRPK